MFRSILHSPDALSLDIKKAAFLGQLKVGSIFSVSRWYYIINLIGFIEQLKTGFCYLLGYSILKTRSKAKTITN